MTIIGSYKSRNNYFVNISQLKNFNILFETGLIGSSNYSKEISIKTYENTQDEIIIELLSHEDVDEKTLRISNVERNTVQQGNKEIITETFEAKFNDNPAIEIMEKVTTANIV